MGTVQNNDRDQPTEEEKLAIAKEIADLVSQLDKKFREATRMGLHVSVSALNMGWRESIVCRVWEEKILAENVSNCDETNSNMLFINDPDAYEEPAPGEVEQPCRPHNGWNNIHGIVDFVQENRRRRYILQ